MLKVLNSSNYEKNKESIYRYYYKNHEKCVAINVASKKRWRAFQKEAKILRMILVNFFDD